MMFAVIRQTLLDLIADWEDERAAAEGEGGGYGAGGVGMRVNWRWSDGEN